MICHLAFMFTIFVFPTLFFFRASWISDIENLFIMFQWFSFLALLDNLSFHLSILFLFVSFSQLTPRSCSGYAIPSRDVCLIESRLYLNEYESESEYISSGLYIWTNNLNYLFDYFFQHYDPISFQVLLIYLHCLLPNDTNFSNKDDL